MAYLYSKVLRVTLICLVTANLSAQTIIELDSVLISATTIPASIKEVSKSVSIISAEEINSLPVQSIDELLGMYAGVFTMNLKKRLKGNGGKMHWFTPRINIIYA